MKPRDAKWILLCGAGVGWLVGLSISPVVGTVVASLLGALAGLASGMVGLDQELLPDSPIRRKVGDFRALGLLLFGIILGSAIGILFRTHWWLSPSVKSVVREWSDSEHGMDRKDVAKRLFDERYPPVQITEPVNKAEDKSAPQSPTIIASNPGTSVLFTASVSDCDEFRAKFDDKDADELRNRLKASASSTAAQQFGKRVQDPEALRAAVEIFLCQKQK